MKSIMLSFFLVVLTTLSLSAQTGFGLKAGISMASYRCADSEILSNTSPVTSYYVAGYLNTRISRLVDFHPEVSLQGKGSKLKESQLMGAGEIEQKTKWLDFAFNFLGNASMGDLGSFFIGGGPYAGFAMDGTNNYTEKGTTTAVIIYDDNALKSLDYGVNLLTGIKFAKRFSINANYRLGLANIAESAFKWSDKVNNRVFSVGLGVRL